jgi:hypothetical protein
MHNTAPHPAAPARVSSIVGARRGQILILAVLSAIEDTAASSLRSRSTTLDPGTTWLGGECPRRPFGTTLGKASRPAGSLPAPDGRLDHHRCCQSMRGALRREA